jgi:hypothetical protein
VELLGGDVAIALVEKELGEGQALPRGAEPDGAEALEGVGEGTHRGHPGNIGRERPE